VFPAVGGVGFYGDVERRYGVEEDGDAGVSVRRRCGKETGKWEGCGCFRLLVAGFVGEDERMGVWGCDGLVLFFRVVGRPEVACGRWEEGDGGDGEREAAGSGEENERSGDVVSPETV
ncbi:hypothetical protein HAX54_016618, partial [Datura stramonium]|nr:hypothetical protein [Datura stramonium]